MFTLKSLGDNPDVGPFLLTEKGEFYLHDLKNWPEYRKEFGEAGRSIFDMSAEGDVGRYQLEADILEFLVAIAITIGRKKGYLRVSKAALFGFFQWNYGHAYWRRFESRRLEDGDGYSLLNARVFQSVFVARNICQNRHVGRFKTYVLGLGRVFTLAREAGLAIAMDTGKLSEEDFAEFCERKLNWSMKEDG